ncbi:protein-disulfide reductase DsbD family protein, partial [Cerasicoccus arenae]
PPHHNPGEVTFFSANAYVEPSAPQVVTRAPNGTLTIELTKSEYFSGSASALPGVLRAEKGWLASGEGIGMSIDPTFGATASTPLVADSAKGSETAGRSYFGLLALAFLGGLILNLMPCVFPVIGLKVMGFVNQAGESPGKVIAHGLVYTLGVLVSFWAIGLMFEPVHQTFLSTGQAEGGWAAWLTPRFVLFLIILVFVFSLSLSGLFEFGVSAIGLGSSLSAKAGYAGTFSAGLFAVAVGAPCAAPFLAPVLGALVKTSLPARELLLTMLGLGLAAPYLILSFFPGLTRKLPRPGPWMETFKEGMAFLLYATVAALVWVVADQVVPYTLFFVLISIVLAGMGSWVFGRWGAINKTAGTRRIAVVFALILIVGPVLYTFSRISEDERREHQIQLAKETGQKLDFLVWEPWSPETVSTLLAEGRPVYIDFTARWCATCQVNKRVYKSKALIEDFQKNNVATLKADWTDHNLEVTRALAEFGRSAVPFNVLYIPGRSEPVTLPELLTEANVQAALAEIGVE